MVSALLQGEAKAKRNEGLGFRLWGFKDDDDGRPPTKAGKSGEKLKKGPGPHTAGTNVWWVPRDEEAKAKRI